MKIKLFYKETLSFPKYERLESDPEFEARVNNFTADKQVIDIKYQETKIGKELTPSIMVMYNEKN